MRQRNAPPKIRAAALELFSRKGIAATSVGEIASRAGCSQGAIYKHWESKDLLAQELFTGAHTGLMEAMASGADRWTQPEERILGALVGLVRYARTSGPEFGFLFHVFHGENARWLAGRERPLDLLVREIRSAVGAGALASPHPVIKAALLLGMAVRVAWFERQGVIGASPETVEAELIDGAAGVLGV
jgi:AcrR family transcriptional regulator